MVVGVHQDSVLSPMLFIKCCNRGSTKGVSGKMNTLKFRNVEEWPAN